MNNKTDKSKIIDLKDRIRDHLGVVILKPEAGCELLYSGEDISDFLFEDCSEIQLYNKSLSELAGLEDYNLLKIYHQTSDVSQEEFDHEAQSLWTMPEEFRNIDVEEILIELCSTDEERDRVHEEMVLFRARDLEPVLRCLIWLVSEMRKNNIVWGVGRGSSCASYCLYLIGVHKVNSLKFGLNIDEFLR